MEDIITIAFTDLEFHQGKLFNHITAGSSTSPPDLLPARQLSANVTPPWFGYNEDMIILFG